VDGTEFSRYAILMLERNRELDTLRKLLRRHPIVGIIGAFIGAWLFPQLGVRFGGGIVNAIVSATIGAVLLLIILRVLRRRGRW
jgi:hypothetical protein